MFVFHGGQGCVFFLLFVSVFGGGVGVEAYGGGGDVYE